MSEIKPTETIPSPPPKEKKINVEERDFERGEYRPLWQHKEIVAAIDQNDVLRLNDLLNEHIKEKALFKESLNYAVKNAKSQATSYLLNRIKYDTNSEKTTSDELNFLVMQCVEEIKAALSNSEKISSEIHLLKSQIQKLEVSVNIEKNRIINLKKMIPPVIFTKMGEHRKGIEILEKKLEEMPENQQLIQCQEDLKQLISARALQPKLVEQGEETLKILCLSLAEDAPEEIDKLMIRFSKSQDIPKKDQYLLWLWKSKFNIPFAVNTGHDTALFWIIKNLAESVNVNEAKQNLHVIRALAKSTYEQSDKKNNKQICVSMDLAIAMDNSIKPQDKAFDDDMPHYKNASPIFSALLSGFCDAQITGDDSEKMGKEICDVLMAKFYRENGKIIDNKLKSIVALFRIELEISLKEYIEAKIPAEKEEKMRYIKRICEIAAAVYNQNYELAKLLAKELPQNSDQYTARKALMHGLPYLLIAANIFIFSAPYIPIVENHITPEVSGAVYAAIVMLIPLIIKLARHLDEHEYFTAPGTLRDGIENLRPRVGKIRAISDFFFSSKESNHKAINNVAREIANAKPSEQDHPLYFEKSGKLIEKDQKTDSANSNPLLNAVVKRDSNGAARMLTANMRQGLSLYYDHFDRNKNILTDALCLCVENNDIKTFTALIQCIKNKPQYGKFTFDFMGILLNGEWPVSAEQRNDFMYAIMLAKMGQLNEWNQIKGMPFLSSTVEQILDKDNYKNSRHLRILAMMAKMAMKNFRTQLPEDKDQKSPSINWSKDISAALGKAASCSAGPLSPHGYVDPFTAIMSSVLAELSPRGVKLDEGQVSTLTKLITHQLSEKIESIETELKAGELSTKERRKLHDTRDVLKENKKLIEGRVTMRLKELNSRTATPWIASDYRHLKNLVHYAQVLASEELGSPVPMKVWRLSEEPQNVSQWRWFYYGLPICFTLTSPILSARGLMHFDLPQAAVAGLILFSMFAATATEKWAAMKKDSGAFLPPPVSATNNQITGNLVESLGNSVKIIK
ncbi:MAG: hypothetical protein QM752_06530 [Gammaproteobacteria bacterium]